MEASLELAATITIKFEGLRLEAYHDPVGFPTQGYGRLLSRNRWENLSKYPPIAQDTAKQWLLEDLQTHKKAVQAAVEVLLTPWQEAALIDFTFNVGEGNLRSSTLLKKLNNGDYEAVPNELRKWVYASGQLLKGLQRRREAEVGMWLNGTIPSVA